MTVTFPFDFVSYSDFISTRVMSFLLAILQILIIWSSKKTLLSTVISKIFSWLLCFSEYYCKSGQIAHSLWRQTTWSGNLDFSFETNLQYFHLKVKAQSKGYVPATSVTFFEYPSELAISSPPCISRDLL